MLTIKKFKDCLKNPNHPDWLLVGVDSNDESQLYILSNAGIANINCAPIELYAEDIKYCAQDMISQGELYLQTNEKPLRIGNGQSVYSYSFKSKFDDSQVSPVSQKLYFSNTFLRWQRSHQLSDEHAQEKLGLQQFRDDELTITQDLINKLAEVTGSSEQFWKNRLDQKNKGLRENNENI